MTALSPEQESLSDAELLAAFARSGDEAAFTTIMGRYAALIRATAQRTTGRSAMVEEVAQSVFALLARKAGRMGRTDHLAAWLHRTAVYLSLRHVRADARHRRKLSAFAAAMPESFAESLPSPAWEAALPVLDECIQRLGAAERRILVMRFFEGHTYPVIGAATGKSEAAVKKQTTRALARLRVLMQRRGAVLTAAALTTGLSSLTAPHAAAGVTSLATAALRAAPSLTPGCVLLHSLHVMNTTHAATAAAALILLGSVPLLLQENAIASARRELSSLENRTASAKPTAASPGTSSAATPRAPEPAGASTLESIARDLETLQSVRRDTPLDRLTPEQRAARSRIAALTTPEFDSLLGAVPRLSGGPDRQAKFRAALFNELTVRPADRASRLVLLHHAPEVARAAGSDDLFSLQQRAGSWLTALLKEDPDAAVREFVSLTNSGGLEGRGTRFTGQEVYGQFVGSLYALRPTVARELYVSLAESGRINALFGIMEARDPASRAFVLEEIARLPPRGQATEYQMLMAIELAHRGLAGAAELFHTLPLSPEQAVEVAAGFAGETNSARAQAGLSVPTRLQWLREQLPPDSFARAGALFLSRSIEITEGGRRGTDTVRMAALRSCDWGPHRDLAIATFFERTRPPDRPDAALALAVEITDPALRMETLQRLRRRFQDHPADYQTAVQSSAALTPAEKEEIFRQP